MIVYYVVDHEVGLQMEMKLNVHEIDGKEMYEAFNIIARIETTRGSFPGLSPSVSFLFIFSNQQSDSEKHDFDFL